MRNKINFFNSEAIIRLTPIKDNTLLVANNIINGKWKIFPTLPDLDIEDIDSIWEMRYPSAESTYSLYTYALYPLSYLLNAYEISGDENYLDRALLILQSFIFWINSPEKHLSVKRKKILYGDHAVSNRTQSLCYLLLLLKSSDKSIPSNLIEQLIIQGKYLSDIDNYSNYNHGLMMDLALLGLVNVLKGNDIDFPEFFKSNLLERLNSSLLRDVTEDGVHIENSPGYHFWIMSFYKKINKPLLELDKNLAEKCEKVLNKTLKYAKYITRSDGSVPAIGDTHATLKSTPSHTLSSKFFSDSNIVIFRDLDDKFWAFFNSGYRTHIHKHADNGAFNLFYKDRDIFIDPGFLNYESQGESLLIKSAAFHNTIRPVDYEMKISSIDIEGSNNTQVFEENLTDSKILGFFSNEKYEASLALISEYDTSEIHRLVIFDRKGFFIIYDCILGNTNSDMVYEQRFNVAESLNLSIDLDYLITIEDYDKNNICKIKQLTNSKNSISIAPRVNKSFYASGFNIKSEIDQLVFTFKGMESLVIVKLIDYPSVDSKNISTICYLQQSEEDIFSFIAEVQKKFY